MIKLIRVFFLLLVLLSTTFVANATHNRAGEITYQFIGNSPTELKYRITITTYTKTSSVMADRQSLDSVYYGDGSPFVTFPRISKTNLPNDISVNIYQNIHTYNGNGTYNIHFTDPNRNEGVVNIPNSVYVPFYIESILVINPILGLNSSPILTYPPIDKGCVNRIFIHNANAYDPDGDSLSYQLVQCGGDGGQPIPGYIFPSAPVRFDINPITGDLTWDSPQDSGEYNVAFNIIQWRNGVQVGYVRRDMQILIAQCNNQPPVFLPMPDTCVLAGDTLNFVVTAIDPNGNNVALTVSGGPFVVTDPATFTTLVANNDTATSRFTWATTCNHIRSQPYYAQFKAQDIVSAPEISLVSLKGVFIRVIGPGSTALTAVASGSSIDLNWNAPSCGPISTYRIYRRTGMYTGTIQCPCDNGVPASTGFVLIATVNGNTLTYNDNNNGAGLIIGVEYCYLVTGVYLRGSESCASPQACASLKKDAPVITNADVTLTDNSTGAVYVAWSKPTELDTIQYPGPYEYRLFHSPDLFGGNFSVAPIVTFSDLNDTIFTDTGIDTRSNPWSYKVAFYYTDNGVLTLKANTAVASTVFLTITPTDNRLILNWTVQVPWSNYRFDILKQNPVTLLFDSLTTVTNFTYTDTNLVNGQNYCYYIRSVGTYAFQGFIDPIVNRSQQVCATPIDNISPCSPVLGIETDCSSNTNVLTWNNPNNTCADDVLRYYIFYSRSLTNPSYELIDTTTSADDTVYYHRNLEVTTGCYRVVAVDSVGNQTLNPLTVCVDTCRQYVLPSVFSPNGDGVNDLFHPCDATTTLELQQKNCPPYKNVKAVNIKIFNRWGNLVYESNDINVNWDGKNKDSKKDCPEGVYFYTAEVHFFRIIGDAVVQLHGTVELLRR